MAGVEYKVTIDDAEMQRDLKRLYDKLQDMTPVWETIGEGLQGSWEQRFADEVTPSGAAWPALSPVTIAWREARGFVPIKKLRMRGHLVGSINYRVAPTRLTIGSPLPYAAIQNFGGAAGRGLKVTIPAREYVGLSDADRQMIGETISDWLAE